MSWFQQNAKIVTVPEDSKVVSASARAGRPRVRARPFNKGAKSKPKRSRLASMTLGDTASLAMNAWRTSKYITSMINVEQKYWDVINSTITPTYSGSFYNLSNIAQGADVTNRDGDSILMRRLELRVSIYANATVVGNNMRLILFRDMQQDGVDPTLSQVIDPTNVGAAGVIVSPHNYFYSDGNGRVKRFDILKDIVFQTNKTSQNGTLYWRYDHSFTGGDKHIYFDATAGADASNREGMLGLFLIGDDATNNPTVFFSSRLVFTDN